MFLVCRTVVAVAAATVVGVVGRLAGGGLGPGAAQTLQTQRFAFGQLIYDIFHGYGCENLLHVESHLHLPVLLGRDFGLAAHVGVHLGPLGLEPLHKIAAVPASVGIHILYHAHFHLAGRNITERVVARCGVADLLEQPSVVVEQLEYVAAVGTFAAHVGYDRGESLRGVSRKFGAYRVVALPGDIEQRSGRNREAVSPALLPVGLHNPAAQRGRVAAHGEGYLLCCGLLLRLCG